MSYTVKETESKTTPAKKNISLKNISVKDLKLVDTDTGEDITEVVLAEIPEEITTVDFKISIELEDADEE